MLHYSWKWKISTNYSSRWLKSALAHVLVYSVLNSTELYVLPSFGTTDESGKGREKKLYENKTNERWWRKIMKDIILWDISIGNGYCRWCCRCRRRHNTDVVVVFAITICIIFFVFHSFSRLFIKYRTEYHSHTYQFSDCERERERQKNVLFGRGDKILCVCVFFYSVYRWCFALCRLLRKCAVCCQYWDMPVLASFARDAELLMPLVLVKYCNVPLERQFLWLRSFIYSLLWKKNFIPI